MTFVTGRPSWSFFYIVSRSLHAPVMMSAWWAWYRCRYWLVMMTWGGRQAETGDMCYNCLSSISFSCSQTRVEEGFLFCQTADQSTMWRTSSYMGQAIFRPNGNMKYNTTGRVRALQNNKYVLSPLKDTSSWGGMDIVWHLFINLLYSVKQVDKKYNFHHRPMICDMHPLWSERKTVLNEEAGVWPQGGGRQVSRE